jgi:flavin reductase (DIM6/NTAB) family NADH-FMN oxidoreductase RutF
MEIDPKDLKAEESYRLLIGIVVPRPIAWVSTISRDGVGNIAPFSMFTFVSPKPPTLAISIGHKAGVYKDTARNILDTEEYVVHIADRNLLEAVHRSADEFPADVSEVDVLGLEMAPSRFVKPPRVAAAPVSMECRFRHCFEFGETRSRLIIGEVVMMHIRDGLVRNGKVESAEIDPIARLGGPKYATLGDIITMQPIFQTPKS